MDICCNFLFHCYSNPKFSSQVLSNSAKMKLKAFYKQSDNKLSPVSLFLKLLTILLDPKAAGMNGSLCSHNGQHCPVTHIFTREIDNILKSWG